MEEQIPGQTTIFDYLGKNHPLSATESLSKQGGAPTHPDHTIARILTELARKQTEAWAEAYRERHGIRPSDLAIAKVLALNLDRATERAGF